jgi:hypothetical protein
MRVILVNWNNRKSPPVGGDFLLFDIFDGEALIAIKTLLVLITIQRRIYAFLANDTLFVFFILVNAAATITMF